MVLIPGPKTESDKREAVARFARRVAAHEPVVHPLTLDTERKRLYLRRTLREGHRFRIRKRPEVAQRKLDALANDEVSFFSSTTLLFYRDMAGTDSDLPRVFSIGDLHPEKFGVMPSADMSRYLA